MRKCRLGAGIKKKHEELRENKELGYTHSKCRTRKKMLGSGIDVFVLFLCVISLRGVICNVQTSD